MTANTRHDVNTTLETLAAIHHFCATITKEEFLNNIGHETAWGKLTKNDTAYPDVYTLLSFIDCQTQLNLVEWLHNQIDFLKDSGFLGGDND